MNRHLERRGKTLPTQYTITFPKVYHKVTFSLKQSKRPSAGGTGMGDEGRLGEEARLFPGHPYTWPDIILWSEEVRKVIMTELTVPLEDGCEEALERKCKKDQDLVHQCRGKGLKPRLFPVDVGFPAQSVWKMLTAQATPGGRRRMMAHRLGKVAEQVSCWIWSRREARWRWEVTGHHWRVLCLRVETPGESRYHLTTFFLAYNFNLERNWRQSILRDVCCSYFLNNMRFGSPLCSGGM